MLFTLLSYTVVIFSTNIWLMLTPTLSNLGLILLSTTYNSYVLNMMPYRRVTQITMALVGVYYSLPLLLVDPKYMYKHYHDALAICRVHRKPQYFITFTCNVRWPEYKRYMHSVSQLYMQNIPDTIAQVFKIKVHTFINFLKEDKNFGEVTDGF